MLETIRILEVEGLGPGPFAGMLLADLGAEVIVVHRKGGAVTPGFPDQAVLDRGKRSIALDLKDPDDIDVFKALVASADGLIEGFRPGVMEKLGLGPDVCQTINPALVYGRMTGWGQTGPMAERAGHDLNYIGLSGALWYASEAGQAPTPPPTLVGDIGGGAMYLAVGMLAGLLNAWASGKGTVVDAAIYDGSAHMMNLLMVLRQSGLCPDVRGAGLLDGPHWSRVYQTSDQQYMSVQCLEPKFYQIFLDKMGLSDDADFQQQFDKALWPVLTARLKDLFATKSRTEWAALFDGSDACVGPVLSPQEAMDHPVNEARQIWLEEDGVLQAAAAPRFSTEPTSRPGPIPKRGEHSADILASLGLTAQETS